MLERSDLKKSLACFTVAQDESIGLRMWLAHYAQYAPDAAIYILDHDSAGSFKTELQDLASAYGAIVVPVHHRHSFNYEWLKNVVETFMAFLLQSFSFVCFSEIDELVMPVDGTNLNEFINAHDARVYRACGYNVVHAYPTEPDLDWHKPILRQRQSWYPSLLYSKVCLSSFPVFFNYGFHKAYNVPEGLPGHKSLLLCHMHQADFKTALRRHQKNAGKFWSPTFRLNEKALHQRLDNPSDLQKYLLCDLDNPTEYAKLEAIPAGLKDAYTACVPIP